MAQRTTIPNWQPLQRHVQNDIPDSSQFVDSKTVLIAAGPPKISSTTGFLRNVALPIGVMENISVQQSKTVQRIFEIGSLLSYFVPGRMIGQVSFGRSLYNGASLLKALYNSHTDDVAGNFRAFVGATGRALNIKSPPGVGDFFGNLGSDLFNHPFGLLLAIIDNNLDPYGGIYLQDCHIQGHQFSVNSQSTVLVEGASAQFDIAIPVNIAAGILAARQSAGFIATV